MLIVLLQPADTVDHDRRGVAAAQASAREHQQRRGLPHGPLHGQPGKLALCPEGLRQAVTARRVGDAAAIGGGAASFRRLQ